MTARQRKSRIGTKLKAGFLKKLNVAICGIALQIKEDFKRFEITTH